MGTRRSFLQTAALTAMPLGLMGKGSAAVPRSQTVPASLPLYAVLADPASTASRWFASRLASQGAGVRDVARADVTSLWRGELAALWQRTPAALAGLTPPVVMFCLEQLAWPHGLQVQFHAEHVLASDGSATHRVLRDAGGQVPAEGVVVPARGPWWPGDFAARVAGQFSLPVCADAGLSCAGLMPSVAEDSQVLASWIIAPRRA